ncbi:CHASE3 domain-containing protein, partial [Methylobacterium soli]
MLSFFANLKIALKIGVTLVLLIAVGVATSVISLTTLTKIENTARWTAHTHAVIQELNTLVSAMVNQETGLRGYLVSGNESFLEPYRAGASAYADAHAAASRLTADNPAQQKRLADLDGQTRTWRTDVAEREIALMRDAVSGCETSLATATTLSAFGSASG